MTIYDPPAYAVSRLRYYDGEFLKELDFIEEQFYHVDRQQRHQRLLHVAGIAEGLGVTVNTPSRVTIGPGTALDDQGRLILLAADRIFDLPGGASGSMYLEIAFHEDPTGVADPNSTVSSETRFTQSPQITLVQNRTPGTVLIATLAIAPGSSITVDKSSCAYSGVRLPSPPGKTALSLSVRGDGTAAELSGSLYVDGELRVPSGHIGVGTTQTEASLDIVTTVPQAALDNAFGWNYGSEKADLILARTRSDPTDDGLSTACGPMLEFRAIEPGASPYEYTVAQIASTVNNSTTDYGGGLAFLTSGGGSSDPAGRRTKGEGPLARMTIDGYGNVSILQYLYVGGYSAGPPNSEIQLYVSGYVEVTDGVGIGRRVQTPEAPLDVATAIGAQTDMDPAAARWTYGFERADLILSRPHSTGAKNPVLNSTLGPMLEFRASEPAGGQEEYTVAQIASTVNNSPNAYGGGLAFLTSGGGANSPGGRRTKGAAPVARLTVDGAGIVSVAQNLVVGTIYTSSTVPTAALYVNGGVGIGTATPSQALVVSTGKVGIGYNSATQAVQLAVNGKVGIGSNDPAQTASLAINGNVGINITTPSQALVITSGKVGVGYNDPAQTASLAILGNVGLGTTTPNQAFVVNTGKVGIGYNDGAQTAGLAVNGSVGIGTSAPAQTLVVNTGNVGIGYNSGSQTAKLAVSGNVGIGTMTPRSALDTDVGVMTGAANDYMKAQFELIGGGTVSWNSGGNNRLSWSMRFVAWGVPLKISSDGGISFNQPTLPIPASQVYDGNPRDCTGGVLLNAYEVLWGVHTVGGTNVAVTYYITNSTIPHDFIPPSNWIMIATVNGDPVPPTVKLGTGVILPSGTTKYTDTLPIVTATQPDLRVLAGVISSAGAILSGTGFTATRTGTGSYTISFSGSFSQLPAFVCSIGGGNNYIIGAGGSVNSVSVSVVTTANSLIDFAFSFIAIGRK